jgi:hypothetical protein
MGNAENIAKSLPYSYFHRLTRSQHHWVTNIYQFVFIEAVANCTALRVVRRHLSEQREQRASNFQNISNVSLIFISSTCINLLRPGSKGKFLYFYIENCILYHCLSDLLLSEIKQTGYMTNLPRKQNLLIVKHYFDEIKQLLMRLDIMDMTPFICGLYYQRVGCLTVFIFIAMLRKYSPHVHGAFTPIKQDQYHHRTGVKFRIK